MDEASEAAPIKVSWPPLAPIANGCKTWSTPNWSWHLHLPLWTLRDAHTQPTTARVARTKPLTCCNLAADLVEGFKIGVPDMAMIYMSPDPFTQTVDLRKFDLSKHPTGSLSLYERDGWVHFAFISPSTPTARIHDWHTRIRGAWLIRVDKTPIGYIVDVATAFAALRSSHTLSTTLLFSHPKIRPNLSQGGIPIVSSAPFFRLTHDQLNNGPKGRSLYWLNLNCRASLGRLLQPDLTGWWWDVWPNSYVDSTRFGLFRCPHRARVLFST